jgi:hypothetical protein
MLDGLLKERPVNQIESLVLVGLFLVAITLPGLGLLFRWHVMTEQEENRRQANFPSLARNSDSFFYFPENFTAYFNDHFGFRATLVHWNALAKLRILGQTSSPRVMVGKNGWLYLVTEFSATGKHLYPLYSEDELRNWKLLLEGRRDWLAQRGIRYIFTVFPRKEVIYPEFLPDTFHQEEQSRLDQLTDYLKKNSDVEIVDLRPGLLQAKADQQIYYQTDTHWNFRGGYSGYQSIIRTLRNWYPDTKQLSLSDCSVRVESRDGDLAAVLGLRGYLREETSILFPSHAPYRFLVQPIEMSDRPVDLLVTENQDHKPPSLVMFDDSAGGALVDFFSTNFRRGVFVFYPRLDRPLIESERPDVVIQEMGELGLLNPESPNLEELKALNSPTQSKTVKVFARAK